MSTSVPHFEFSETKHLFLPHPPHPTCSTCSPSASPTQKAGAPVSHVIRPKTRECYLPAVIISTRKNQVRPPTSPWDCDSPRLVSLSPLVSPGGLVYTQRPEPCPQTATFGSLQWFPLSLKDKPQSAGARRPDPQLPPNAVYCHCPALPSPPATLSPHCAAGCPAAPWGHILFPVRNTPCPSPGVRSPLLVFLVPPSSHHCPSARADVPGDLGLLGSQFWRQLGMLKEICYSQRLGS